MTKRGREKTQKKRRKTIQIFQISDENFKITMINMTQGIQEKMDIDKKIGVSIRRLEFIKRESN